jgi:hypothetical protein
VKTAGIILSMLAEVQRKSTAKATAVVAANGSPGFQIWHLRAERSPALVLPSIFYTQEIFMVEKQTECPFCDAPGFVAPGPCPACGVAGFPEGQESPIYKTRVWKRKGRGYAPVEGEEEEMEAGDASLPEGEDAEECLT